MPPTPPADSPSVADRLAGRRFPSVFQAWNPADNLPGEDPLVTLARHDLAWVGVSRMGVRWNHEHHGLADGFEARTIPAGLATRRELLGINPCMVLLVEIRYRDAWRGFLPDGHRWWKRDEAGLPVAGWEEGRFLQLDFANPEYRNHVAGQARSAVRSGVFDGVLLDWWFDDDERLALLRAVREAIGPDALIIVNMGDRTCPRSAELVNGLFMECTVSDRPAKWDQIRQSLAWAEANLRRPRVNCLETWYQTDRRDLHLMRATTTLALTVSDGFCLFADPNPLPTPDHLHDWYGFWDKRLGPPLGPARGQGTDPQFFAGWDLANAIPAESCRALAREYEGGTVVYNPADGESIVVRFARLRTSLATGRRGTDHYLANCDGDIYLD